MGDSRQLWKTNITLEERLSESNDPLTDAERLLIFADNKKFRTTSSTSPVSNPRRTIVQRTQSQTGHWKAKGPSRIYPQKLG